MSADPIDVHVGRVLRMRRLELGLSQKVLGEALGITFQQVQKYELGANRISASKLFTAATFLKSSIGSFFEGLGDPTTGAPESDGGAVAAYRTAGAMLPEIAKIPELSGENRSAVATILRALPVVPRSVGPMARSPLARVERRPEPAAWTDQEPMTLVETIAVFFPEGPLTVATLRAEIRKGRLAPSMVGGRLFITPGQVRALFKAKPCPDARKARASTFGLPGQSAGAAPSGSSGTERGRSAQVAARQACQRLRDASRTTSRASTPQPSAPATLARS